MRIANNTEWLFFHLWKRNPETSLPCQNLNIAETILFRWAQPYFWYSTAKDGTLVRKTKDKVVLSHVEEAFSINASKCNVIGTCLNSVEDPNFKTQEKIEFDFVEQSDFHNFLFQKEKPMNLIFQKFVEPKNNKNALIKVSWTPQFCIFFRRTNNNDLSNTKIPLVNRLATFEGAEHLSTSDSVSAPILASELEQTCVNIVKHIQNVTGGNIQISRMVLYFKLDDRNRLWLLFCTGLKFRDKVNPFNKATGKKKNQRPLSPIFTMASKKEEKNTKIVPQEYLLEDQVNEVNTDACLRCNCEGLLYDIKIKMVLGYEERVIKEGGGKKPEEIEPFVSPYKSYDPFDKKHDIGNVPVLMTKLYPNITEERYAKLKLNMSFMNTAVKLCEECYLLVTESLIENNEERKAKSLKRKLQEKSPKNENVFGMQQSFKEPEPTISKHKMNQMLPLRSVMEEENSSPVKLYSQSARSSNFVGQLINKTAAAADSKPQENKLKKNPSAFSFQVKPSESQSIIENEEKAPKVVLPQIDTVPHESSHRSYRASQGVAVKEHYFRLTKNMSLPEEKFKIPVKSPYNQEISVMQQSKDNLKKMNISGPIIAFKDSKPNKKVVNETAWTPREGIWSQSTKNASRTNFTSMMSTIKDLKMFLGQNLEKKQ